MEIFNWQKNARKGRVIVLNKEVFSTSWVAWWKIINPSWREADGNQFKLTDNGQWSTLFVPGKNGFLNVIGGLVALQDCIAEAEWEKAVRDVRWTIERTLAAKIGCGYVSFTGRTMQTLTPDAGTNASQLKTLSMTL